MQRIIHVLQIHTKPEEVYEAIATANGLSSWWSTNIKAEEKVGGIVDFTFMGDFNPDMQITALARPNEVGWECIAGHDKWKNNRFSFEIAEKENGAQLKFTQVYANEISDVDYGTYNFNWGYYLHSLKEYCETGKGKPFSA